MRAPPARNRSRLRRAVPTWGAAVLAALSLAACRSSVLGRDAEGLPNFGRVDDGLYRSGQPTHDGLVHARDLGVRTVVELRANHPDGPLLDGTGLGSVAIPSHAWHLDDEHVARFLAVATDPARRPVLVHCRQGRDRTGALVAAYRIAVQGWPREQAIDEMSGFGAFPFYDQPRRYLRAFDPACILERARALREERATREGAGDSPPDASGRAPARD